MNYVSSRRTEADYVRADQDTIRLLRRDDEDDEHVAETPAAEIRLDEDHQVTRASRKKSGRAES